MSNSGTASQKPAKSQNTPPRGSISKGLKEIHIDEEVKIAMNLSLERFRYSDQKGINCFYCFMSEYQNKSWEFLFGQPY